MNLAGMIVGLGNPGKDYEATRHNFGFMLVDALLDQIARQNLSSPGKLSSGKQNFELWKVQNATLPATSKLLLKPLTFMNNSGLAVAKIASYYNIHAEHIIVAHDELDLPLGSMRFKFGGGTAGHNGIKSIIQHLGADNFYRLRLGIGKTVQTQTIGHVLGHFGKNDSKIVLQVIQAALEGLNIFDKTGYTAAKQFINGFELPPVEA